MVSSTDRRNTVVELFSWRLILQGLSWTFDGGAKLEKCANDGGVVVVTADESLCWNPATDETTECDDNKAGEVDNCVTEPVTEEHLSGRLNKAAIDAGTMVQQPDTNTTVGTRTKPLSRKITIQNMIRK